MKSGDWWAWLDDGEFGGGGELIRGTLRYMGRHGLCATLDACSTYYTHAMEHCTSISSVNVPTLLRNN